MERKFGLVEALLLVGGASLVYGVFRIYVPAGYIVLGLALISLAYLIESVG